MPKVLVITYEFPPSGGGGVQRWAKMCRYLPEAGWIPVVLAATPVGRRSQDESLLADVAGVEVHRIPHRHVASAVASALEPLKRARRAIARRGGAAAARSSTTAAAASVRSPLSNRLARLIAVPDDAAYWRGPAARAAERIARQERVDAIVATGPPFSALVAGARVAERTGLPLVLDMRDGWDTNPVVRMPTALHQKLSNALERAALPVARLVTCTAPAIAEEAARFGARRTLVIPNGFDPADLPRHAPDPDGPLTLVFMGKVYAGHSDPAPLLKALARATERGVGDIRFEIIGSWPEGLEARTEQMGLADVVRFIPYLPHRQALERTARADIGVLLIADRPGAEGSCPAKLYEYLGMGMPVLIVGPSSGMPAMVLNETRGGVVVHPDATDELVAVLLRYARAKASGEPLGRPDPGAVARYDRRRQAAMMAEVLSEVAGRGGEVDAGRAGRG